VQLLSDSKFGDRKIVWVRVPPPALAIPHKTNRLHLRTVAQNLYASLPVTVGGFLAVWSSEMIGVDAPSGAACCERCSYATLLRGSPEARKISPQEGVHLSSGYGAL
jgi:hypothetical protein